mmetsp:Transcript_37884/g.60757  ORF Transcript_37884/g.60757 Transcript_37884/m.60757 type:complete len:213 (+) Transcript_37884:856-1494(+)
MRLAGTTAQAPDTWERKGVGRGGEAPREERSAPRVLRPIRPARLPWRCRGRCRPPYEDQLRTATPGAPASSGGAGAAYASNPGRSTKGIRSASISSRATLKSSSSAASMARCRRWLRGTYKGLEASCAARRSLSSRFSARTRAPYSRSHAPQLRRRAGSKGGPAGNAPPWLSTPAPAPAPAPAGTTARLRSPAVLERASVHRSSDEGDGVTG